MIKIYFSNYSKKLSNSDFLRYLNLLPPEFGKNITRFQRWEDQHASLYGKLLLMKALEESGFDSNLLHLKYTKYGRPYLENIPSFNISHSGFFAVCALSFKSKIGVDIEEIKPVPFSDYDEVFSREEWNKINNSDNPNYWFYYYWTAKEAVIKADGGGMNWPLKEITINENKATLFETSWFVKPVIIDNDYILQIAADQMIDSEIGLSQIYF